MDWSEHTSKFEMCPVSLGHFPQHYQVIFFCSDSEGLGLRFAHGDMGQQRLFYWPTVKTPGSDY